MEKSTGIILKVLSSKRGKSNRRLRWKLVKRGVNFKYAVELARREQAESLLGLEPKKINEVAGNLPEIKKRWFKELGLPTTPTTIQRNPKTLLENKQKLKKWGLTPTIRSICRKPETLLENKRRLKELGLPVNGETIFLNPEALWKKGGV